ncbi:MAG TPA: dTDP-4-amino-4,6-dideoxygalactose transaminase [Gemmatimonadaceae bacterium]|nr:dTDP-4-amino-4,6-dideoxygalactose transaminase [Gemmatimonadaceae bacterium]
MIPFNKPALVGPELDYIRQALEAGHLSGNGGFTRRCHRLLGEMTGTRKALLTHSCTSALEMAAILAGIGPGDEVIMPSFTFVSTANAFVLRGATPVFVDVRDDTFNLDERLVEAAVTERTRAIVPVHYAGVACEMPALVSIAERHGLLMIEDAAQALGSTYAGRPLGSYGQLSALSFHETKNVISGEGGALLVNDESFVSRAEIIWEKGTNRAEFLRGDVDKYTWVDIGSSFLPGEIVAAFLCAQLESASSITERRRAMWNRYHVALADAEAAGQLQRPRIPEHCGHNGHMYYVLLRDIEQRTTFIASLRAAGIGAVFHYVPLHSAPAGRRFGRADTELPVTDSVSDRLVRLPLWPGMESVQERVVDAVLNAL